MDCIKNKIWTTKSNDYIISFDNINSDAQITNINYMPTNGDVVDDQPTLIGNNNENKFKHYETKTIWQTIKWSRIGICCAIIAIIAICLLVITIVPMYSDISKTTTNTDKNTSELAKEVVILQKIASDRYVGDSGSIRAAIRLAQIWSNNITATQLSILHDAVSNADNELELISNTTEIAISIDNRLQLIDAIVIDDRIDGDAQWFDWYSRLLNACFYSYSSRFKIDNGDENSTIWLTNNTEIIDDLSRFEVQNTATDDELHRRIYRLINDKIELIFSDQMWSRMSWKTTNGTIASIIDHRIGIVSSFCTLLNAYRSVIDAKNLHIFTKRFNLIDATQSINCNLKSFAEIFDEPPVPFHMPLNNGFTLSRSLTINASILSNTERNFVIDFIGTNGSIAFQLKPRFYGIYLYYLSMNSYRNNEWEDSYESNVIYRRISSAFELKIIARKTKFEIKFNNQQVAEFVYRHRPPIVSIRITGDILLHHVALGRDDV